MSPYLSCAPVQKRSAEINTSLDLLTISNSKPSTKTTLISTEIFQPPPRKPIADNSFKRVFNPDDQMLVEYTSPASDVYFQGISTLLLPKQRAPENNSGE